MPERRIVDDTRKGTSTQGREGGETAEDEVMSDVELRTPLQIRFERVDGAPRGVVRRRKMRNDDRATKVSDNRSQRDAKEENEPSTRRR